MAVSPSREGGFLSSRLRKSADRQVELGGSNGGGFSEVVSKGPVIMEPGNKDVLRSAKGLIVPREPDRREKSTSKGIEGNQVLEDLAKPGQSGFDRTRLKRDVEGSLPKNEETE
ncbi:MAG: hypothetical protein WA057_04740 [Candidatus Magasanikiibacteriota bacterium]